MTGAQHDHEQCRPLAPVLFLVANVDGVKQPVLRHLQRWSIEAGDETSDYC
jgi:hypothetical protein